MPLLLEAIKNKLTTGSKDAVKYLAFGVPSLSAMFHEVMEQNTQKTTSDDSQKKIPLDE
jgi:hypothetical protein